MRPARSLPSSLQVLLSDTYRQKHIGVLSHFSLEMRKKNTHEALKIKKKKWRKTHLRHQSAHSLIVAPIWLCNCVVILCRDPFWLYLLIVVAPGNPTLSCSNRIKTCRGMTPNAVRKTSRIWGRLLEFNLIKHSSLPFPTRQSVSYGKRAREGVGKKKPLGYFEVSFLAPDIPLYTESWRVVQTMIQPDRCVSSQCISQA